MQNDVKNKRQEKNTTHSLFFYISLGIIILPIVIVAIAYMQIHLAKFTETAIKSTAVQKAIDQLQILNKLSNITAETSMLDRGKREQVIYEIILPKNEQTIDEKLHILRSLR